MLTNKILLPQETELLRDSLVSLAEYHNSVTENNDISYPSVSIDDTIRLLAENIVGGKNIINAYFEDDELIAFCVIGIHKEENHGELKYLFVRESHRKHGVGDSLIQWAMDEFDKKDIELVDIRVVLGNPALTFYEKYGFKPRIMVMSKRFHEKK